MTATTSVIYPLPCAGPAVRIHRVAHGSTLFSALVIDGPQPQCHVLDPADRHALGADVVVASRPGRVSLQAVRAGISGADDELVGTLWSGDDGTPEWVVPVVPTPRGQVLAALLMSIHEARTSPGAVLPPSAVREVGGAADGGGALGVTDDTSAITEAFGLTGPEAASRRVRTWSDGGWVLVAQQPEDHHDRHLARVLQVGRGSGELLLSRDGTAPRFFAREYTPSLAGTPDLPRALAALAEAASAAIWRHGHR